MAKMRRLHYCIPESEGSQRGADVVPLDGLIHEVKEPSVQSDHQISFRHDMPEVK
jgi:hypothetical protein